MVHMLRDYAYAGYIHMLRNYMDVYALVKSIHASTRKTNFLR